MTIDINDFKKQLFLGVLGNPETNKDFETYAAEKHPDQANGYLEATHDFVLQLEEILGGGFCRNGAPTSAHLVQKRIVKLLYHKKEILNCIENNQLKITRTDSLDL